jgi:hypothetical protein
VYQRALLRELSLRGIRATAEASFAVTYKGHSVGEYKTIEKSNRAAEPLRDLAGPLTWEA